MHPEGARSGEAGLLRLSCSETCAVGRGVMPSTGSIVASGRPDCVLVSGARGWLMVILAAVALLWPSQAAFPAPKKKEHGKSSAASQVDLAAPEGQEAADLLSGLPVADWSPHSGSPAHGTMSLADICLPLAEPNEAFPTDDADLSHESHFSDLIKRLGAAGGQRPGFLRLTALDPTHPRRLTAGLRPWVRSSIFSLSPRGPQSLAGKGAEGNVPRGGGRVSGSGPQVDHERGAGPPPLSLRPFARAQEAPSRANVDAEQKFGPGLTGNLSSQFRSVRHDDLEEAKWGLTIRDTLHALSLGLGAETKLEGTFSSHAEGGGTGEGIAEQQRQKGALALSSQFGADGRGGIRLAMTSEQQKAGERWQSRGRQEAHLDFAPVRQLKLNADYVVSKARGGSEQKISTLAAAMQLAPKTELSLSCRTVAPSGGRESQESRLKLATSLGAGDSKGTLRAERAIVRTEDVGVVKKLNCALAGSLGAGASRTNLSVKFQEDRGEGTTGILSRLAMLHLDRRLGSRLALTIDHQQRLTQTGNTPVEHLDADYRLTGEMGENTTLSAALGWLTDPSGVLREMRDVCVEHKLGTASLEVSQQFWRETEDAGAISSIALDIPSGKLPKWARDICRGHVFRDSTRYLLPDDPSWEEMEFAGYRLVAKRRRGGIDDGLSTLTLAHRRVVADRYHIRLLYQECPESERGLDKGRPMLLGRELLEVGVPVRGALTAFGRFTREPSISDPGFGGRSAAIGLQGRLSETERLQCSLSREAEQWEAAAGSDWTRITLLYSRRLDEEHQVSLRLGYAWGEEGIGREVREYRLAVGYNNPI